MRIHIIVAYNNKRVIGNNGKVPWHLPEDLQFFKETTTNHTVIMGRKTWDSIPEKFRPLPDRLNIILTSSVQQIQPVQGLKFTWQSPNIISALQIASYYSPQVYVIGGEQVYRQFLEQGWVDQVTATEVFNDEPGDAFFPELQGEWAREVVRQGSKFNIVQYNRVLYVN